MRMRVDDDETSGAVPAISFAMSQGIKGGALLLMVYHHCFGFRHCYVDVPAFFENGLLVQSALTAKLCVAIFAFLTGWVYCHHRDKSYIYSLKKIVLFLAHYWVACAFCAIVAVVCCSWRPSLGDAARELFPNSSRPLMIFCWYVSFYVQMMLLFPILRLVESHVSGGWSWLLMVVFSVVVVAASYYVPYCEHFVWFSYAAFGYCCARARFLELFVHRKRRYKVGALMGTGIFLLMTLMFRQEVSVAIIYMPRVLLFIACLLLLSVPLQSIGMMAVLSYLGKHSMNIWFVHSLFFCAISGPWMQKVFFICMNPLYIFCVVLIVSLLVSLLITPVQKQLTKLLHALMPRFL